MTHTRATGAKRTQSAAVRAYGPRAVADADDHAIHRSRSAFLRWARHRILEQKDHPLRFLLGPKEDAGGRLYTQKGGDPRLDWHCFTYLTRTGRRIRARVPVPDRLIPSKHSDDQRKFVVQAGHRLARVSGGVERFMLEDADLNKSLGGDLIESKGAISRKEAVILGGIPVDFQTALLWCSVGQLDKIKREDLLRLPHLPVEAMPPPSDDVRCAHRRIGLRKRPSSGRRLA